ncbi:MAG TPA: 50S ribosomal protein L17 [Bacteroidales bacterium]|nr:50S ribosomal protein L17 [Bacteroidales bacterium]
MRHRKKFNHLKRNRAHRRAMLANMASSLILHKRIQTTLAKAKALRPHVEPLITKSKTDNTASRRIVFASLRNKEAVNELFRDVATKVADRPGGYTRIIKLGMRQGDSAEMAMIELVDYNENLLAEKKEQKKSSGKRTRRAGKKVDAPTKEAEAVKETPKAEEAAKEEAPKAEAPKEEPKAEEKPAEEKETKQEEPKAEEKPEEKNDEEKKDDDKK